MRDRRASWSCSLVSGLLVSMEGSELCRGSRRLAEAAAGSWLPSGKSPLSLCVGLQVGCVNTMGDMSREGAAVVGMG